MLPRPRKGRLPRETDTGWVTGQPSVRGLGITEILPRPSFRLARKILVEVGIVTISAVHNSTWLTLLVFHSAARPQVYVTRTENFGERIKTFEPRLA